MKINMVTFFKRIFESEIAFATLALILLLVSRRFYGFEMAVFNWFGSNNR